MELMFAHQWSPAKNGSTSYHYGESVSPDFKLMWAKPAVYRWNVFQSAPGDLKMAYVGEAEILTRRIYHYSHPGPSQQTNLRLKAYFERQISEGHRVLLEVLDFEPFTLNGLVVSPADLTDKLVRRFVESLAGLWTKQDGFTLLNL